MLIIPAIDLKDGRCVRLFRGDMDRETAYFERPAEAARQWVDEGAEFLHVVDLNGAVAGHPVHQEAIGAIVRAAGVPVELGGGLRSLETIEQALSLGVERVVIGTAAYESKDFLREACARFPAKIVAGIDAREGRVAIKGWRESTSLEAVELAGRCVDAGVTRIIYTDINRDGTGEGVNIEEVARLACVVKIPIIASGGVASLEDLRRLKEIEKEGVEAVIIGRALYNGALTLKDAMAAVR
jgi:phosphoribosylformimino-5-aminoimidazole carboxamide ribotide isomerase